MEFMVASLQLAVGGWSLVAVGSGLGMVSGSGIEWDS